MLCSRAGAVVVPGAMPQHFTAEEYTGCRSARRGTVSDAHGLGTDALTCDALRAVRASLLTMCAGDALAAPLHWYYSDGALREHRAVYARGEIDGMLRRFSAVLPAFTRAHPDSSKYFRLWQPEHSGIVHSDAEMRAWRTAGTHYHANLRPGESTSTVQLALLLTRHLGRHLAASAGSASTGTTAGAPRAYDREAYLDDYVAYFRTPGRRTDTYIEQVHRDFFATLASGRAPRWACGADDACLSGLTVALPLLLLLLLVRHLVRARLRRCPAAAATAAVAGVTATTGVGDTDTNADADTDADADVDGDDDPLFLLAFGAARQHMRLRLKLLMQGLLQLRRNTLSRNRSLRPSTKRHWQQLVTSTQQKLPSRVRLIVHWCKSRRTHRSSCRPVTRRPCHKHSRSTTSSRWPIRRQKHCTKRQ